MRRIIPLLFLLVPLSFAQNCPPGYTTNDNKVCYKVYSDLSSKADASLQCFADGGYLASVPNAFANSYIVSLAKNAGAFIWLGIQCYNGDRSTCVNDDKSTFGPYSNFAPGNPSTFGTCVYLSMKNPTNMQWVSFDCSAAFAYVCEYPLAPQVRQCPNGYTLNGNSCYAVKVPGQSAGNAELDCNRDCGHLVSIHSDVENSLVTSLTSANAVGSGVIRIGLKVQQSSYYHYWSDQSVYNYSKIEYDNVQVGECYVLALQNGIVSQGSWTNDNCQGQLPYICKTAPGTCAAPPTLSPPTCNSTQYYSNYGSIYSPGYPNGYSATNCVNFISTQQGTYVKISVGELFLDSYATIQLFNSISDIVPFTTITSTTPLNSTFQSTSNQMVVVFTSNIAYSGRWKLNYSGYVPIVQPTPKLGCQSGYSFFQGMCYVYVQLKLTNISPNKARTKCRQVPGGNLATINNDQVNRFIETLETRVSVYTAFGLRCTNVQYDGDRSSCHWDDMTPFDYNTFPKNNPQAVYGSGCCDWNDGYFGNCGTCDGAYDAYICQAPAQPIS